MAAAAASKCTVTLQVEAFEAYANREFGTVLQKLADILAADPNNPRWYEMRAQVRRGGSAGQVLELHRFLQ